MSALNLLRQVEVSHDNLLTLGFVKHDDGGTGDVVYEKDGIYVNFCDRPYYFFIGRDNKIFPLMNMYQVQCLVEALQLFPIDK